MTTKATRTKFLSFTASGLLLALVLGFFTTPYIGLATFSFSLMSTAMLFRRGARHLHRSLMYVAMAIDLVLVLTLEVQRDAIGTVVALKLGLWQSAHVAASTLALVLYVPMILAGTKLWNGETPSRRQWHRRLGFVTYSLRTLGFVLMFSLLAKSA